MIDTQEKTPANGWGFGVMEVKLVLENYYTGVSV